MVTTNPSPATTAFTRDVLGRYVCNGLDEALRSTDRTVMRNDGRPQLEARDFDLIILGGGTFGGVLAEHLSFRDTARNHRILVLEAGLHVLDEHVQNLPVLDLAPPGASTIPALMQAGQFGPNKPRNEVWGLPWQSTIPFPGLAYCIGGRSLYWGGWSPELLSAELPTSAWPTEVVDELTTPLPDGSPSYFQQASEQIGVSETNDFIFGDLHRALREQLFNGLEAGAVPSAIALATLPDHPAVRFADHPLSASDYAELLDVPAGTAPPPEAKAKKLLKLEAPLAVQGQSGHAGFFPFNKFSAVPLMIKAAREAYRQSRNALGAGDDARKRLMIVPGCHVNRLHVIKEGNEWRVTEIDTNQGLVRVPPSGKVVIALGTIESARLVKDSFRDFPQAAWDRIGTNLMAHLRSNLTIRIPRTALASLPATVQALQASALFVKGRHTFADSTEGHFHLQITASGLGALGMNSEAELFKKIPDIDTYEAHRNASDSHVVITIRGIGEMQSENASNQVALHADIDEFGRPRAAVALSPSARDLKLWDTMDQAAKEVATIFGVSQPPDPSRDGFGTTHHETGALYMGASASNSVTLPDTRVRHTSNTYVAGPALFPTIGSPNPMLTGVAMARRLGDHLARPVSDTPDPGFMMLFDGADTSHWRMTTIRNQPGRDNPGFMRVIDGTLETAGGTDMGIFWCTIPTPANFILRLQWLRLTEGSNSGIYLRFPDPESKGYNNTAFVPDDFGFEVQIDEHGDMPVHRTGAIYRKDNRTDNEVLNQQPAKPVGVEEWNDYEIRVDGQLYTVKLNGDVVCTFDNSGLYPDRGKPSTASIPSFIGLQVYANPQHFVRFRRVQIKAL